MLRQSHGLKDGEVRYKRHTTVYAVERLMRDGKPVMDMVLLVKADGTSYRVWSPGCDCKDEAVRGRERQCKHYTGCVAVGLLEGHR